jgi:hypothetical protein
MANIIDLQERTALRRILSATVELQERLEGVARRDDFPAALRRFLGRSRRDWNALSHSDLIQQVEELFRLASTWLLPVATAAEKQEFLS